MSGRNLSGSSRAVVLAMGAFASGLLLCGATASAQQNSYPVVIGSTGKPYGPTQAEWQYRQQYGRPSPGSQGNSGMRYVNGYPGGVAFAGHSHHPGWGGWGPQMFLGFDPFNYYPSQGYIFYPSTATFNNGITSNLNWGNPGFGIPPNPLFSNITPPVLQPLPPNDPLFDGLGLGNSNATINNNPFPTIANAPPVLTPSPPKAVENSFQYQTQGDIQFQMLNYYAAGERYRKAIDAARDRADPRVRLALTLAARSRFFEAVDQLKLATAIDPTFPQVAASLEDLFGASNLLEKARVKERVAEWTLQDPRDPNRLFLLGALLYLDGDPKAEPILQAAVAFSGEQPHLTAFLSPRSVPIPRPAQVNPGDGNEPPAVPGKPAMKPTPAPPKPQMPEAALNKGNGPQSLVPPIPEPAIPATPPMPREMIPPPPATDSPVPGTTGTGPDLPPLMSP